MYNLNNTPNTKIEPIILEAITNDSIFFIGSNDTNVWRINNEEDTETIIVLYKNSFFKIKTDELRELILLNNIKTYGDIVDFLEERHNKKLNFL